MSSITLKQLAEHVGGRVVGDGDVVINSVTTIDTAGPGQITFLSNQKYLPKVETTKAAAVIVSKELESTASLLIVEDPYYAFMQIVVFVHGHRKHKDGGISENVSIADTATIGKGSNVHDFVTISDNATVGDDCNIYPGVFIGPNTTIGNGCIIYPNAVIYDNTTVGNRVIIHASASIGQDGFGFATHKGVHHKIPQIGKVIIEDDAEVGANTAIERGTLEDTIIGAGSKIGDAVTIGHGAIIGPHCLIVPQVGIAGSTSLGHHCVVGGQAGIAGHIKIGNMVQIGAGSGVSHNIPDGQTLLGIPAVDASLTKRIWAAQHSLPNMRKKFKLLDKRLKKLEEAND